MYDVKLTESLFPAQTDTPYRERTIPELLREQAETRGESKALRELLPDGEIGREWTFAEYLGDSEKMGRALASRHGERARIAIFASNCPEWILIQMGAALAGVTLVTVNPAFTAREVRYVLEQAGCEAVYYLPVVRGTALRPIVDEACSGLDAITCIIAIDDHDALFAGHDSGELRATTPDSIVQIQYTSGTTGFPKGVLLHQHGLIQSNLDVFRRWHMGAGHQLVCPFPLFHTAGSAVSVLGCLAAGTTLLIVNVFDPAAIVRAIQREKPEFVGGVPTMLFAIIEAARQMEVEVGSVQRFLSGGAMVAPELSRAAQATFGAPIQIIYGQTETSPGITATWPDDAEEDLTGTIGQPLPHMDVAIRSPDGNAVCPVGEQGEICIRGYNVMAGYNDNPEATAETIDAEGWLHTGDLGTMDKRGYLKITGRVKEMIIRGGENLFPVEIENAMLEHPAIGQVAVAGIPDEKWGETVACFMECAGETKPSPEELKAFIRERLAPHKTPAYWVWVTEWPMTGSGKIQRFVLADQFVAGEHEPATA